MKKMKKTTGNLFHPDEIITNILSKLPAKSVMRFRLVCKTWRDLTSCRYFVDLNLRSGVQSILVTGGKFHSAFEFFVLDKWWDSTDTSLLIHRFPFYSGKFSNLYRGQLSHAGLIVLLGHNRSGSVFIILNPARPSHECVRIILPKKLNRSKIYGVYFHPLLKEYCALLVVIVVGRSFRDEQSLQKYKIVNLGSNPSSKTISNPCDRPIKLGPAKWILMNNYLYWLLECEQGCSYDGYNDIMEYDIINEEFMIIPCPVPVNTGCIMSHHTWLLNIDGFLSFFLLMSCKITIWRLEDRKERLWTTTKYTLTIKTCPFWEMFGVIAVVNVVNGKLAILSRRILFVYNLTKGMVEYFQKCRDDTYAMFFPHEMSLASLKNCKSTISIDKDGEVAQDGPDLCT